MNESSTTPPDEDPEGTPEEKKPAKMKPAKKKPRARTIEITITSRDVNDPTALLQTTAQALEKANITTKYVWKDEPHTVTPNEQFEAKVNDQVADHLDKKAANAPKPGDPSAATATAADPKKAEEDARGRIKRSLIWLAVNGVKLAVKAALDWGKAELKKKLGGG